jgi:hypothetical protein
MFLSTLFQEFDPTSLTSVLLWVIAGPGVVYLVGRVMALILENVPAWHNLPGAVKFLFPVGLAAVFGVVANLLLAQPELIAAIEPWFKIVALSVVAWLGSQVQYLASKEVEYGRK